MIKSDRWIKEMAEKGMINPYFDHLVRLVDEKKVVSFGQSSYGYDIRLGSLFKVYTNVHGGVIDSKNFNSNTLIEIEDDSIIIPPHGYILASIMESFAMPNDVTGIVFGKSTLARMGILANGCPLEAGWSGYYTMGIANLNPNPVRLYAGEGIAQVLFLQSDELCSTDYEKRGGKYQGSTGITLPTL